MEANFYLNKICFVLANGDEALLERAEEYARKMTPASDKPKRKTNTFTPPTVEEVAAYCEDRGNGIDAAAFVAHYTANGWTQGKNHAPVKDWKACVITWERSRGFNYSDNKKAGSLFAKYQ